VPTNGQIPNNRREKDAPVSKEQSSPYQGVAKCLKGKKQEADPVKSSSRPESSASSGQNIGVTGKAGAPARLEKSAAPNAEGEKNLRSFGRTNAIFPNWEGWSGNGLASDLKEMRRG